MYIHIYVYMFVCIYTYTYIYMLVYIYIYIHIYVYMFVCIYTYICHKIVAEASEVEIVDFDVKEELICGTANVYMHIYIYICVFTYVCLVICCGGLRRWGWETLMCCYKGFQCAAGSYIWHHMCVTIHSCARHPYFLLCIIRLCDTTHSYV